ncbi:three-helix bundle dimerization domain-containing protein [Nonomuraea sp. SYSU D8015]|uniref:three-helix bundle dimerization domain-containing protein n=1 Tax=Nonomuraea sp. SYSU D8015 TaxID=2593644 RepID=UPI003FA5E970
MIFEATVAQPNRWRPRRKAYAKFANRPIRDFVPVLVEQDCPKTSCAATPPDQYGAAAQPTLIARWWPGRRRHEQDSLSRGRT